MESKYIFGKSYWRTLKEGTEREWLVTNGIGGFANGTIIGNTSRIHSGYLIASLNPPVDRKLILSKTCEMIVCNNKEYDLSCQQYIGYEKDGYKYLQQFELDIVPTFIYQINDIVVKKTICVEYEKNTVVVCYEIENGTDEFEFRITPLFSCRDLSDTSDKSDLNFKTELSRDTLNLTKDNVKIKFYTSCGEFYDRKLIPTSMATPNYLIEENQLYLIDNRNGFLGLDNHFTPYDIRLNLKPNEVKKLYIKCTVDELDNKDGFTIVQEYRNRMYKLMDNVSDDNDFLRKLSWSADQFIVNRKSTNLKTILAGYPWFTDWGRDTMIALQGLTLCTNRFEDTKQILESFSLYVQNGLIPNMFPNSSDEKPLYNTIDASLWYFYSVDKYLNYTGSEQDYEFIKLKIYPVLKQIIEAYKKGTLFSIKMQDDGLISGGDDLDQITWMDVRVGNWVVTPRHGKPVEINALWYNALKVIEKLAKYFGDDEEEYTKLALKVKTSFNQKFWNEQNNCLYDVVDEIDDKIRPNQIWAVSLPYTMLDETKELKIVQTVYKHLYTSYGLRSLDNLDKDYKPQYIGKLINRDSAYHMGTSWAFLMGGFITAYCKVYKYNLKAVKKAEQMLKLFYDHMNDGCINGIAEIFDGDFSCTSRGCYNQAWSVGEILRAYTEDVLPYIPKDIDYYSDDLGIKYTKQRTEFKLWAPTAKKVDLVIYDNEGIYNKVGKVLDNTDGNEFNMKPIRNGAWEVSINSDLKNKYYMYKITFKDGNINYAVDPYAMAVSANGQRGAIIDLEQTNPPEWDKYKYFKKLKPIDAIIYELHIRDFSINNNFSFKYNGKFKAFTEEGLKTENGNSIGIDHLVDLGINYVHILPAFDFQTINELSDKQEFNWGYDPQNYNVPEGSYSTDAQNPITRIKEFKEMVKALHKNGIGVIMDVVYNHTFSINDFCYNKIVPGYFHRKNNLGEFTNGSGCGNEVDSQKLMVRKYIKDSVKYWVNEYGIDGFRFDLMGLLDTQTMEELTSELKEIDKNILIYGEPWQAGGSILPLNLQALKGTQKNKNFAVFNDNIRNAIKGSTNGIEKGFAMAIPNKEKDIVEGILGSINTFTALPSESINYVSAHDDLNLWDKIVKTQGLDKQENVKPYSTVDLDNLMDNETVKISLLSNGIVFTSQGIPFIHAGDEILRSKFGDHNSYKSSDKINQIYWENKDKFIDVYNYYKGLIKLRKSHPAFRMDNAQDIRDNINIFVCSNNIVAFEIKNNPNRDIWKTIIVIYNSNKQSKTITLPKKCDWNVVVNDKIAGTDIIETLKNIDKVVVNPISINVLVSNN